MDLILKHTQGKAYYTKVNNNKFFCNSCKVSFVVRKNSAKFCIASHESSSRHQSKYKNWLSSGRPIQPALVTQVQRDAYFNERLTEFAVALNIPWLRLNHHVAKTFIREFCNRDLPDESTLRKLYFVNLYNRTMTTIRKELGVEVNT